VMFAKVGWMCPPHAGRLPAMPPMAAMIIRFWGVRGSIPVPGPATNRYGGNTSCVSVQAAGGPLIIIHASTGSRRPGKEMMKGEYGHGPGQAPLLISHTHWDHIQGL